jgi:hypothetical protein
MSTQLNPIKTGQITWEVTVTGTGYFTAVAPGMPDMNSRSYDDLEQRCKEKAAKARVRVSVPYVRFTTVNGVARAIHGTATGIHAGNGKVLTREPSGTDQVHGSGYYPPMEAADEARVIEIMNAETALRAEHAKILGKYRFGERFEGLSGVVRKAIDAALAAKTEEGEAE